MIYFSPCKLLCHRINSHTYTDASNHRWAGVYSNAHICSLILTYTNTYTGSFVALALFHSLRHTHTCWARRPDGITAWAVGLSHSGDLISHCFFSFTHPFSSLIFNNLQFHFFLLLPLWPFYLLSDCRLFVFADNSLQRSIVLRRLCNSQRAKLLLKALFDSRGIVEGQVRTSHSNAIKKGTNLSLAYIDQPCSNNKKHLFNLIFN